MENKAASAPRNRIAAAQGRMQTVGAPCGKTAARSALEAIRAHFSENLQEARDAVAGSFVMAAPRKNPGLNVNWFTRAAEAADYDACG